MGIINQNANLYDRDGNLRISSRCYSDNKSAPMEGDYDVMYIGMSLHEKSKRSKRKKL